MNLLEKIEASLDCATPPMSDLLRECVAYVRAAGECEELLLIAHMDGHYKGKQDGQKVPDGMQLVPDSLVEFITQVQGQTPEKPDYWSSCGQCEHNANRADDLLDELKAARGES